MKKSIKTAAGTKASKKQPAKAGAARNRKTSGWSAAKGGTREPARKTPARRPSPKRRVKQSVTLSSRPRLTEVFDATAAGPILTLSGPLWVAKFPGSKDTDDLVESFRGNTKKFIAAMESAGAKVDVSATFRPVERAHLMHYSFGIAKGNIQPAAVPTKAGIDIQWVHPDVPGKPAGIASKDAAKQMVQSYGIVSSKVAPALNSRHTEGRAIDMAISWTGDLTIKKADGKSVTITTAPRSGLNTILNEVGASYGVIKFKSPDDPPHWSSDGQ